MPRPPMICAVCGAPQSELVKAVNDPYEQLVECLSCGFVIGRAACIAVAKAKELTQQCLCGKIEEHERAEQV